MKAQKKAIYLNLICATILQVTTLVICLVLPRLYITEYGSETNGLLNSVNQFMVYFGLFEAGVGAATLQALYKPVAVDSKKEINAILTATHHYYKKAGKLYFLALLLFSLAYPLIVNASLDYVTISGVVLLSGVSRGVSFCIHAKYILLLQAEGKNYVNSIVLTVITVLTGVSKIVLIQLGLDVLSVLAVSAAINLLSPVCLLLYIKTKYSWITLKEEPNQRAISQKNYALVHQIATMVFNNTDVLILTVFCDLKIVSVYSLYKLVITQLENILSIFSNGVSFSLGQTFQTNQTKFHEKFDIYESVYSILAFTLFSVAMSLLLPFVRLYTNGVTDVNYSDCMLVLLFVSIALLTAIRAPMLLVIQFAGHFKLTTPQTIVETFINLTFSIVGVQCLGIYGVLLGTIMALVYRTTDVIIYSNRKLLNRSPWKTLATHAISMVVLIFLQIVYSNLEIAINSYVAFVAVGVAYVIVAFAMLLVAHCVLVSNFRRAFLKVVKT